MAQFGLLDGAARATKSSLQLFEPFILADEFLENIGSEVLSSCTLRRDMDGNFVIGE